MISFFIYLQRMNFADNDNQSFLLSQVDLILFATGKVYSLILHSPAFSRTMLSTTIHFHVQNLILPDDGF